MLGIGSVDRWTESAGESEGHGWITQSWPFYWVCHPTESPPQSIQFAGNVTGILKTVYIQLTPRGWLLVDQLYLTVRQPGRGERRRSLLLINCDFIMCQQYSGWLDFGCSISNLKMAPPQLACGIRIWMMRRGYSAPVVVFYSLFRKIYIFVIQYILIMFLNLCSFLSLPNRIGVVVLVE